jgi:hypothetical protein
VNAKETIHPAICRNTHFMIIYSSRVGCVYEGTEGVLIHSLRTRPRTWLPGSEDKGMLVIGSHEFMHYLGTSDVRGPLYFYSTFHLHYPNRVVDITVISDMTYWMCAD